MQANALTVIHKLIRTELFELSRLLGSADPAAAHEARRAVERVAALLRGHAAHEDAQFEPLLRAADTALAARMAADHQRLEDELERICYMAGALDASDVERCAGVLVRLHLDWNRFVGAYLGHLDDEERGIFPVIAAHLPPLEFIAASAASRGPDAHEFLQKLRTVLTPQERAVVEGASPANATAA